MILPAKHLPTERSLLGIGACLLALIKEPRTVSSLWDEFKKSAIGKPRDVPFDWFVLALNLLFMMKAIEIENELLKLAQTPQ